MAFEIRVFTFAVKLLDASLVTGIGSQTIYASGEFLTHFLGQKVNITSFKSLMRI